MPALNLKAATVLSVNFENAGIQNLIVEVEGREEKAVNYLSLGSRVEAGQRITVNTTAVDLDLGSGGCHFVVPASARLDGGWGHQMKLRYTPLQVKVNCAEEQESPWHHLFQDSGGLAGIPVLTAELHSMLPPLVLAIKVLDPGARIVYVVTDGGALPAAFSRNTAILKQMGAITHVVTSGHSFGGDLETVNIFTGLQAAARVAGANYIVAAMGPGIAGTGTVYGFSGMEQGFVLQAVRSLGGQAVFVPRLGFKDQRPRHQGLSHHSLTVLTRGYSGPVWVPMPVLRQPYRSVLFRQMKGLPARCRVHFRDGSFIARQAQANPGLFSSMGRNYAEDINFFLALGAAGRFAVELYRSKPCLPRIAIK